MLRKVGRVRLETPGFVPHAWGSVLGAGQDHLEEAQQTQGGQPHTPAGVSSRLENKSDNPKSLPPEARCWQERAQAASPDGPPSPAGHFLAPASVITLTSLCSPRHSPQPPTLARGREGLSPCQLPITTWGSVPLRTGQPGPCFGDLLSIPGLLVRKPVGSQSNLNNPTSRTPHSGAATLLSQPHWCAGGGTERKPSSTSWLLSCAQHWCSCSENKGPEAPAEQRKAESSGFQSWLTVARVRNTLCVSTQGTQNGYI